MHLLVMHLLVITLLVFLRHLWDVRLLDSYHGQLLEMERGKVISASV
jgi:hypothetical protein